MAPGWHTCCITEKCDALIGSEQRTDVTLLWSTSPKGGVATDYSIHVVTYDSLYILFSPDMDDAEWDRLGPFLNMSRDHLVRLRDTVYEEKRKSRTPRETISRACTPDQPMVDLSMTPRQPSSFVCVTPVPMVDLTGTPEVSRLHPVS